MNQRFYKKAYHKKVLRLLSLIKDTNDTLSTIQDNAPTFKSKQYYYLRSKDIRELNELLEKQGLVAQTRQMVEVFR